MNSFNEMSVGKHSPQRWQRLNALRPSPVGYISSLERDRLCWALRAIAHPNFSSLDFKFNIT
ncbi:hypothetical protein [Nostoc sp.]